MKPHLLLIDDDQDELRILSDALEQAGIDCKCTWATCPLHALEMLRYLATDLIFIDYHMPKMNGIECIGKIREIPGCGETTIVLYSSELNDELIQAAYAAGAHHCVKKTDNSALLTAALQNLFSAFNEVEY